TNAQKHAAADVLANASINCIMIEDFFRILKTIKGQTIEDLKQIVNISGYTALIDPKKAVSYISNNILTAINFKFNLSKWPTWAQSAKKAISILKTTMIVESHWRLIKHNYINKFNKPHIDLLVWILVEYLFSCYIIKIQDLESNSKTRTIASWCSVFKHNWKTCAKKALGGLGSVEVDEMYEQEDELDTNILVKNEFNDETNKDLLREYKDPLSLLVAKEAMNEIDKMLAKYETLKNRKKLPKM
ncbi:29357_t:CDS:2, partial [Gigaspora margarita]